jgi:hypothetical protein
MDSKKAAYLSELGRRGIPLRWARRTLRSHSPEVSADSVFENADHGFDSGNDLMPSSWKAGPAPGSYFWIAVWLTP